LTEADDLGTTNSPAFEKLSAMFIRAFQVARRTFSPEGRNWAITPRLGKFLSDAGCQNIQSRVHINDYSAGTEAHESIYRDLAIVLRLIQPFLVKVGVTTQEEADRLYQQAVAEMLSNDFRGIAYILTVCGEKP
jgi:hypothetical protein